MSWARCGKDRLDRDVGYEVVAKCDEPDCNRTIDRGLWYCCGGMHGGGEHGCGMYFCENHIYVRNLCKLCNDALPWPEDDDE